MFLSVSLDVHGLVVPGYVIPHQLGHRDRHPHRVALLGLHDVSDLTDEVLGQTITIQYEYKQYQNIDIYLSFTPMRLVLIGKINVCRQL